MEELPILNIIGGILMYLAKFLILIAVILAVYKMKNLGSIVLLIGIGAILIGDALSMILLFNASSTGVEQVVKINGVNSIISGFTHLFFSLGVLVFVLQVARKKVKTP